MTLLLALAALAQTSDRTIDIAGKKRTYTLHVGADAKKPMPLVLMLHGAGGNGKGQQALSRMDALADRHGYAVAYPDSDGRYWRYDNDSDFAFFRALIDELVKDGTVDARRVYASGMSNGSIMSHMLGVHLGDRIAAIGCVAAQPARSAIERAKPKRSMPALIMHGTDDRICGYDGTTYPSEKKLLMPAEEMARWWVRKNGCRSAATVETLPDGDDGILVKRWTFEGGAPVVFYRIEGGGHAWPAGGDLDASAIIWEFFSKHALPK